MKRFEWLAFALRSTKRFEWFAFTLRSVIHDEEVCVVGIHPSKRYSWRRGLSGYFEGLILLIQDEVDDLVELTLRSVLCDEEV